MSFGFSVGDFVTTIQLANKIRRDFVDSPSQFKTVTEEVRTLSIVLQDAEVALSNQDFDNEQKRSLDEINTGCRNVLHELQHILETNMELSSEGRDVGKRMKRAWKRLNWKPEDITQLRSRLSSNISLLNAFNGRLTQNNVGKLVQHQENQEHQTLLDWVSMIDFATQQSDFVSRRETGTGQWLLESTKFQAWVNTNQQVLFCPGIPGAGKTILTSIVVDYLSAMFQRDIGVGVAYLYCNFRRKHEQTAEELLASLVKQLAQGLSSLPESMKHLYDRHKNNRTRPTFNEISNTLQSIGGLYSKIFIVIDALDECQVSDGCRARFLKEIFAFQLKSKVNLFITSRSIPEINEHFKSGIRLEIRASDHDIRRYLDGHMSQLPRCVLRSSELQKEIKTEILKAVDGMFLLAQLYVDSLKGKKSPKAIRTFLNTLPSGIKAYDCAYKDAMERIEGQLAEEEELAKQVLSWITCAKRPLNTSELEHALAVEIGELQFDQANLSPIEDMVSVCAGLVTIDDKSNIIRLVHYTTQEYFERTQAHWFPDAEANITRACITYILFASFEAGSCHTDEEFDTRLVHYILYDYVAKNWGYHAHACWQDLQQWIICLLESKAKLSACIQAMFISERHRPQLDYSQKFPGNMTGIHVAAWFGLEGAVYALIERGHCPDLQDNYGQTPLMWAGSNGHGAVVKLLLEKFADIDAQNDVGETALIQSIARDREVTVRLLLEAGANVLIEGSFGRTALHYAAEIGKVNVVRLLFERGAHIDSRDDHGCTALHWATANGHISVVQTLLEAGAEIEARDNAGMTSLRYVSTGNDIFRLLLESGADVRSMSNSGDSALHMAARNGDEVLTDLLLNNGISTEVKNKKQQVPLHLASRTGSLDVVRLLIEKSATLTAQDDKGKSALHVAAWYGHTNVVKALIGQGADVQAQDSAGKTILQYAASNGQKMIVKILFDNGVTINAQDHHGLTALHKAAIGGHTGVVELLLDLGALKEVKNVAGKTALDLARINQPWHLPENQHMIYELLK